LGFDSLDVGTESGFINGVDNEVVNVHPHLNFFLFSQSASSVNINKSTLESWVESESGKTLQGGSEINSSFGVTLAGGVVEGRSDLERVVVFEQGTKTVVSGVVHDSTRFDLNLGQSAVHNEVLSDVAVVFINEATFTIDINGGLSGLLSIVSVKEIALHSENSLFLSCLHFGEGLVNVVLNPGEVLLGGVAERKDIRLLSEHIILEVLK